MNKSNKKSISSILWIMLFDHTCLNVYMPVYTLIFFDVQSNIFSPDESNLVRSFWYGICLGLPRIGNLFCAPLLSALSDDLGRKKILAFGTFGAMLFALTVASGILLNSLCLVIVGGIIQGMFSRTNPIAQAAVTDVSGANDKAKNIGYLLCAICTGAFIGPLLGGFFANRFFFSKLNFSLPFFIAAIFAFVGFVLTLFYFKETFTKKPTRVKAANWLSIKKVFFEKRVLFISLTLLTTQFTWSMYYQSISPILKKTFHFNASALGMFMSVIAIALMGTSSVLIKILEKRFSAERLFNIALTLMFGGVLSSLICCLLHWQTLIWVAAFPVAVGDLISYVYLVTLYSSAVSAEDQGKVMGICFMMISIAWAVTGLLNGILLGINALLPLVIAPLSIVIAMLIKKHKVFLPNIESQNQGFNQ